MIRYAQKANSNIHILKLMRAEGAVVDAVSLGEIERSLAAGFRPEGEPAGIVFTADLIDHATMAAVIRHGIPVNAGSLDMLERVGQQAPGHRVWLRINPGFGHGHSNKTNTGGPQSKHGIWIDDVAQAIAIVRRHGLKLMGIHMHIGSGVDYGHLSSVCDAMVDVVRNLGHDIEAISAGGACPFRTRMAKRVSTATITSSSGTPRASASNSTWAIRSDWRSSRAASWWPSPAR